MCKLLDFRQRLSTLETANNPFALLTAATLHAQVTSQSSDKRDAAKWRMVRGLHKAGLSKQDVRSFFRLVDWILRLTPEREAQFMVRLQEMEKEKGMPYITSIERIGREAGRTEGRRAALIDVLQARFGKPSTAMVNKLNGISDLEQLRRLNQLAATVESLQDFDRELDR